MFYGVSPVLYNTDVQRKGEAEKGRRDEGKRREGGKEGGKEVRKKGKKEGRREGDKVFFCDSLKNSMDIDYEKILLDLDRFMN